MCVCVCARVRAVRGVRCCVCVRGHWDTHTSTCTLRVLCSLVLLDRCLVDGVCACVCGVRCCVRGQRNQGLHWEEMHRSHVIAGDKYQNAAQRVVDALPKTLRAIWKKL